MAASEKKRWLAVAVRAAHAAGEIQMGSFGKSHDIRFKGRANLVTEIDVKSQRRIIQIIRKNFPHHDVLAEEEGVIRQKSSFRWIIDPVDGTTNYTHGYPMFCVSIGLEVEGKLAVGVVYHAPTKETFSASAGEGAWLNQKRIRVTRVSNIEHALVATGFSPEMKSARKNLKYFGAALMRARAIRRSGSAAIDMAYVACGRLDAYWDLSLKAWDMAAGALLVTEAGGRLLTPDGKKFTIYEKGVLATNAGMLPTMKKILGLSGA